MMMEENDVDKSERLLRNLARQLEHEEPGVSGRILEAGKSVRCLKAYGQSLLLL